MRARDIDSSGTSGRPHSHARVGSGARTNLSPACSAPASPQSPGSPSQPYFKFTDPALQASAVTIKERLLHWCRDKTRDYEVLHAAPSPAPPAHRLFRLSRLSRHSSTP